ncbi:MAG: hypothetical protein L3J81_02725 [Thermoplasmata archaeon]|nr:hypothetical protein [Thermoplasmata archaeon]
MRIERRWAGLLGMTALAGLWAFAVACGDEETPWPETVLSGNPGGGVGGGTQAESDGAVADDTGADDSGDGGDTQTIFNASIPTLCADIAAQLGGYGKSTTVSCPDLSTSTLKGPTSETECQNAFDMYQAGCAATVQNALNCYTATGACSNYTSTDCAALTACGPIP